MTLKPMILTASTLLTLTLTGPAWTADVAKDVAADAMKEQATGMMKDKAGAMMPKVGVDSAKDKAKDEAMSAEDEDMDDAKAANDHTTGKTKKSDDQTKPY